MDSLNKQTRNCFHAMMIDILNIICYFCQYFSMMFLLFVCLFNNVHFFVCLFNDVHFVCLFKEVCFLRMRFLFIGGNIAMQYKGQSAQNVHVVYFSLKGSEIQTFNKDTDKQIEATDMWYLRRVLRMSWTERKSKHRSLGHGWL